MLRCLSSAVRLLIGWNGAESTRIDSVVASESKGEHEGSVSEIYHFSSSRFYNINVLSCRTVISQIRHKRGLRRITPLGVVGLSRSTVISVVIERSLVRFWERRHLFCSRNLFFCRASQVRGLTARLWDA